MDEVWGIKMRKFSLSSLRERFSSPLRISQVPKPMPKIVDDIPVISTPLNIFEDVIPEVVKKEDSLYSPRRLEAKLTKIVSPDHSSIAILKFRFCCKKNNCEVISTNHIFQLCSCHNERCNTYSKYLIKVPIGKMLMIGDD
jgi:hypothetical protein